METVFTNPLPIIKVAFCIVLILYGVLTLIIANQIHVLNKIIVLPHSATTLLYICRILTIIAAVLLILALVIL